MPSVTYGVYTGISYHKHSLCSHSHYGICRVMTFVLLITLACCPDVRRASPINFIILALFVSIIIFLKLLSLCVIYV